MGRTVQRKKRLATLSAVTPVTLFGRNWQCHSVTLLRTYVTVCHIVMVQRSFFRVASSPGLSGRVQPAYLPQPSPRRALSSLEIL